VIFKSLEFKEGKLFLIDQRKLPGEKEYFLCHTYQDVEYAIARMVVRGAPAIGATAAYGLYLAAKEFQKHAKRDFFLKMREASYILLKSRPTAVNLAWALKRMERIMEEEQDKDLPEIVKRLKEEADKIAREDIEINRSIGRYGRELVAEGAVILTHCNTGGLATVGYGTALGVIRAAYERDKKIHVYANETRPWLQGARLTAFELREEGIPVTVIIDSVAATLIRDGKIDLIIVGADRIASNGDTVNKIGTFMLSELAKNYHVPFYVAAPVSTIDFELDNGSEIEIEERAPEEVTHIQGIQIVPDGVDVYNPAFDLTPHENIDGIITEKGIIRAPYKEGLASLKQI